MWKEEGLIKEISNLISYMVGNDLRPKKETRDSLHLKRYSCFMSLLRENKNDGGEWYLTEEII